MILFDTPVSPAGGRRPWSVIVSSARSVSWSSPLISVDELAAELNHPSLRIFDTTVDMRIKLEGGYSTASGRAIYEQAHIPGSSFVDLLDDFSARDSQLRFMLPGEEEFVRAASRAGIGNGATVVLYDSGGPTWWATRMWFMLREFGYDDAYVLDGGLDAWKAANKPIETGTREYKPDNFPCQERRQVFVGKTQVKAALDAGSAALVNALSADVFAGRSGTYARLGRIPDSVHVHALDLLDPQSNRFLPLEQLRSRFGAGALLAEKPVIAYCGGGISACINAFAIHLVGKENVQIYDGSLSEWARDPDMPMVCD